MFNNKKYYKDHWKVQTIGKRVLAYARERWHEQQNELYPVRSDYESEFAYDCAVQNWERNYGDSEFVPFVNGTHKVYDKDGRIRFVLEPWFEIG